MDALWRTSRSVAPEMCIRDRAGATYPYGKDPHDSNIRIAPTSVSVEELRLATTLLCLCVKIATIEKLLENK